MRDGELELRCAMGSETRGCGWHQPPNQSPPYPTTLCISNRHSNHYHRPVLSLLIAQSISGLNTLQQSWEDI